MVIVFDDKEVDVCCNSTDVYDKLASVITKFIWIKYLSLKQCIF